MANIFEWSKIDTNKTSGTAKVKCPICTPTRSNKSDKSLYVRFDSGVAKCFHCEALSFRDDVKQETEKKNYTLPVQTWKNYTSLSDKIVKYFEQRKIQQFVLNEMEITEEKYFQPYWKKEVSNIVFNYFEGDVLVNKKYRGAKKSFTQSKNGKPILYNINCAIGAEEVFIVEGEIDALSLVQIGIKNVVSIPNGANDNDAYWINSEPYLKGVSKFFIATDKDEKGDIVSEKIAQRLGRYRCERIRFVGKDANEDLISGDLEKSIYNREKYPVSGTFTTEMLFPKMLELYDNGLPPTIKIKNDRFGTRRNHYQKMLGHLEVVTGIPSHGKSNFVEWEVLNIINENDYKASFFSPEHMPMELHQSTFAQKFIGKNYFYEIEGTPRMSKMELTQYVEWANQKLYLTSPENGEFATWDFIFEKFKEQLFNFGINIFVVDAYNKVEHTGNKTERENISKVLSRLTTFAQANNVLIILVAHPTKMRKLDNGMYEIPTLYDVSGSADFRNQTHDGYVVYRNFVENYTMVRSLKLKYTFQGDIGAEEKYFYHKPSGRYYADGTEPQEMPLNYVSTFELAQELSPFHLVNGDVESAFDLNEPNFDETDVPF